MRARGLFFALALAGWPWLALALSLALARRARRAPRRRGAGDLDTAKRQCDLAKATMRNRTTAPLWSTHLTYFATPAYIL